MKLVIMTRGRVYKQRTFQSIPDAWKDRLVFVCPPEEQLSLTSLYKVDAVPFNHPDANYSNKFQWIMEAVLPDEEKLVILDDDLIFSKRITRPDGTIGLHTLRGAETNELTHMFEEIEDHLGEVAQCGVHPRQMGHQAPLPFKESGKVITVNGFNRTKLAEIGFPDEWRVDKVPMLADTFLNCNVLTRAGVNRLVTNFCVDWAASQAAGGCDYRTMAMQELCIDALVADFPDFIAKVIKKPKSSKWLGDERVDYRARWKKMAEHGVQSQATGRTT